MSYYKGGRGGSSGYRGGSGYRGSRGGGGEGSWRGGSRGGSSFASSSRGSRYSSYPSPTYDSRSRSSYAGSAADRYSRGARDEPYHRYSQEVGGYSTRDYGRALSPEPPRKRARPDTSPSYMAPRRSHERSFASEYSSGRSYYEKGGASSSAGGYLGEKTYTREVRERGSEFAFRKPAAYSSPRGGVGGGYRGRSGRGIRSRGFRSTSSFLRKRDSFAIRKRAGLSSRSDYIRRLKQLRLRRRLRAARRQKESDDDDVDDDQDDKDEDGEEEDEDASGAEEEATSGEEEEEEEEVEEEETAEDNELEESAKGGDNEGDVEIKEEKSEEDQEKKEGEEETNKKTEVKMAIKKKVVKKVKKKTKTATPKEDTKNESGDKDEGDKEKEGNEEESEKPTLTDFLGQPFIKLKCPHCHHICVTFKEYSKHLETRKHQNAMQELFTKLRKTLATMRMEQRKKQRALDDECKAKNMRLRTFFCSICKLNYRTLKSHHQASASHRKMSEFLLPYCKVCRAWFKSAWSYESHLCELPHIKKKARLEKLARPPVGKDDSLLADQDGDVLDTNSFMILDSVGSGDDSDAEKSDDANEKKEEGGENDKDDKSDKESSEKKKKKKKSEIKLGAEFCKMVEVYYCDLCKIYLPRLDDKERALTIHCRSRTHLQRYVRLNNSRKDDATLRRKAVRLHKERQKLKEKEKKEKKEEEVTAKEEKEDEKTEDAEGTKQSGAEGGEEGSSEETKEAPGSPAKKNGEEDEEKMWSEVDKDLSDLLHDGDEPHDDDEDTKKERYDRFKQSDKQEKNSLGEVDIKSNGALPVSEKKKGDSEEK